MNKLKELITKFTNDKNWNTENKDGSHRFDAEIKWIENMIKEYAEHFGITTDDVVETMETKRSYSWPNYYQEANFPSVPKLDDNAKVYKSFEDFNQFAKENYVGFKCPKCGNIGSHPQECDHRIAEDGKCDWCSYGLFQSSSTVVILESGFKAIPIFEPISREVE